MIIDHDRKFIFVHVYRTGGSSIDRAFSKHALPANQTHKKLEDVPNWKDYFSFGFIRNPWDRAVSSYMYKSKKGYGIKSFHDYVQSFIAGAKEFAQYNMVKNCSYIGRFEHLQEDFDEICDIIGIERFKLPHVWKTTHKDYREYYTSDDMIERVKNHQSGDIDHFGFSFDSTATKNVGRLK